jgi:hypothetical protein
MVLENRSRRLLGLALGGSLALTYSAIQEFTPLVQLAGIPLHQPPLGPWGNTLVWMLTGALLGLISTWTTEPFPAVLAGAFTGAMILYALTILGGGFQATSAQLLSLLFMLLPLVGMLAPLVIIIRWTISRRLAALQEGKPGSGWALAAIVWVVVALLSIINLDPPAATLEIGRMHELIQQGLTANSAEALPEALRAPRVGPFLEQASRNYTLEWTKQDINRFAIPRPANPKAWEEAVVVARFDNGWVLACLFPNATAEPLCKGIASQVGLISITKRITSQEL